MKNQEVTGTSHSENQIFDYATGLLKGIDQGLANLGDLIQHPIDNMIYPISLLAFDAAVIIAINSGAESFSDTPEAREFANNLKQDMTTYQGCLKRMEDRMNGIYTSSNELVNSSGPKIVEKSAEFLTTLFTPGAVLKGVKAVINTKSLGVANPPKFNPQPPMPNPGSDLYAIIKKVSLDDVRNGKYHSNKFVYIITADKELVLADTTINNPLTVGQTYVFEGSFSTKLDKSLGRISEVYAAGSVETIGGRIQYIDNIFPHASSTDMLKHVFKAGGFDEVLTSACKVDNIYIPGWKVGGVIHDKTIASSLPLGVTAYANSNQQHNNPGLISGLIGTAHASDAYPGSVVSGSATSSSNTPNKEPSAKPDASKKPFTTYSLADAINKTNELGVPSEFSDAIHAVLDYSVAALNGISSGVLNTIKLITNPQDYIIYPVSSLAYDSAVIIAFHMGPVDLIETQEARDFAVAVRSESGVYQNSLTKMINRIEGFGNVATDLIDATGPRAVELGAELATTILLPGGVIKGVKATSSLKMLQTINLPTFKSKLSGFEISTGNKIFDKAVSKPTSQGVLSYINKDDKDPEIGWMNFIYGSAHSSELHPNSIVSSSAISSNSTTNKEPLAKKSNTPINPPPEKPAASKIPLKFDDHIDFSVKDIQTVLDYAFAVLKGAYGGVLNTLEAVLHPIDNVIYPVSLLAFDAAVCVACHTGDFVLNRVGFNDYLMKNIEIYQNSLKRMYDRMASVINSAIDTLNSSGPQIVSTAAEMITSILLPGAALKSINALRNINKLGYANPPQFSPLLSDVPTPGIKLLSPKDIRTGPYANYNGADYLVYIITGDKKLLITPNKLSMPINIGSGELSLDYLTIGHRDFGLQKSVFAAGEVRTLDGRIFLINNDSGTFCVPARTNIGDKVFDLETIQRRAFAKNGYPEAAISGACHVNNQPGFHFNNMIVNQNIPILPAPIGLSSYINSNNEHHDAGLMQLVYGNAHASHTDSQANMAARNPVLNNRFFNVTMPHQLPNWQTTYWGHGFGGQGWQTTPWSNGGWQAALSNPPQKMSSFEMQMQLNSILNGSMSAMHSSTVEALFKMRCPGSDSSDYRSALSSCSSLVRYDNGKLWSRSAPIHTSLFYFSSMLSLTRLSLSYNLCHLRLWYNELFSMLGGFSGGVENSLAQIKAAVPICQESHIFAVKANAKGDKPFYDSQLEQICTELYNGIYNHGTFPFFSLHFNDQAVLYPVIHPVYQNTLVGKVIGLLDYHMKGFLNGGTFTDDFLLKWHETSNTDRAYLKSKLKDLKSLNADYQSLREAMCLLNLESNPNDKTVPQEGSVKANKFRTSFRIIAKQNSIQQEGNLFLIDPGFDVEYTIDILPEYQQYLDKQLAEHGKYPEDYLNLMRIYHVFSQKIKLEMPKLPFVKDYFEMLGVINFFCYYYHTLKTEGKAPVIPAVNRKFNMFFEAVNFPKALPPLPVRYYQKHEIKLTFEDIYKALQQSSDINVYKFLIKTEDQKNCDMRDSNIKKLDDLFYQRYWQDSYLDCPAELKKHMYNGVHSIISAQVGDANLDKKVIDEKVEAIFLILQNHVALLTNFLMQHVLEDFHESLVSSIGANPKAYEVQLCKDVEPKLEDLEKHTTPVGKLKYLKDTIQTIAKKYQEVVLKALSEAKDKEIKELPGKIKEEIEADIKNAKELRSKNLVEHDKQVKQLHKNNDDDLAKDIKEFGELKDKAIKEVTAKTREDFAKHIKQQIGGLSILEKAQNKKNIEDFEKKVIADEKEHIDSKISDSTKLTATLITNAKNDHVTEKLRIEEFDKNIKYLFDKTVINAENKRSKTQEFINKAKEKIEERFEKIKKTVESNTVKLKENLSSIVTALEKEIHNISDSIMNRPKMKSEPLIDGHYLHSVLDITNAKSTLDDIRIVGGCGMSLGAITPTPIKDGTKLLEVAKGAPSNYAFNQVKVGEQTYHTFSIKTQDTPKTAQYKPTVDYEQNLATYQGYTPVMFAALKGDRQVIEECITNGANLNEVLPNGMYPLFMAIQNGDEQTTMLILEKGKNINIDRPVDSGITPLHLAIELSLDAATAKLIGMGASLDCYIKNTDYMPIHLAASLGRIEAIKAMVKKGFDVNTPVPSSKKTALHIAAAKGHDVTWLIDNKADCAVKDIHDNLPIADAIAGGFNDIALMLTDKTPLDVKNKHGQLPHLIAAEHGVFDVADKLFGRIRDSALDKAAGRGSRTKDDYGYDYIYYIVKHGQYELYLKHQSGGYIKGDERFDNKNLLEIAAGHGHLLLTDHLLKNYKDYEKNTALSFKTKLTHKMIAMDDARYLEDYLIKCELSLKYGSLTKYDYNYDFVQTAIEHQAKKCLNLLVPKITKENIASALLYAIRGSNEEIFSTIWHHGEKLGINMHAQVLDEAGNTIAYYAVDYGRMSIIRKLKDFGSKFDTKNKEGATPAARAEKHINKSIKELLKKWEVAVVAPSGNAKPKDSLIIGKELDKALADKILIAIAKSDFKQLVDLTSKIDTKSLIKGEPVLHYIFALEAKYHDNFATRALKQLSNFDPLQKDSTGNPIVSLLLDISEANEIETKLKWLKQAFPAKYDQILSQTDAKGLNLSDQAIKQRNYQLVKALGSATLSKNALHYAVIAGDLNTVKELIKNKSLINSFDEKINTPLMYAAAHGFTEIAKLLLSNGANPKLADGMGRNALHIAILHGNTSAARVILDYTAFPDQVTNDGFTPLMIAAHKNNTAVLNRLMPISNLYEVNVDGANPLHVAATENSLESAKLLLKFGMDVNIGSDPKKDKFASRATPLHYAASAGHIEMFHLLLANGADITRVDSRKSTILDYMVASNSEVMFSELIKLPQFYDAKYQQSMVIQAVICNNLEVLRYLYLTGVKLDGFDRFGYSPLHYAAEGGKREVAEFLLESGVSANIITANAIKKTASTVALEKGHAEVSKLIASYADRKKLPQYPNHFEAAKPSASSEQKPGNTAPLNFKSGLTPQEQELVARSVDNTATPSFYALAARIRRELGVEFLRDLFQTLHSKGLYTLFYDCMALMLEIGDTKILSEAIKTPHYILLPALKKAHTEQLEAKYPPSSSQSLLAKFKLVDYPLPDSQINQLVSQYEKVLNHGKNLSTLSADFLAQKATKIKDATEVVAIIRECVIRIYKICPYDTQVMALLSLIGEAKGYKGSIAQINTGEGKSLIVAMAAAFNALSGQKVDVMTTSHNLAIRDQLKYAPLYTALGLTSSNICLQSPQSKHFVGQIIYGTNSDFEFAWMREKLGDYDARMALGSSRELSVVIIDEVDSMLIDESRNSARIASASPADYRWFHPYYLKWIKDHEKFDLTQVKQLIDKERRVKDKDVPDDKELETLFDSGKESLLRQENVHYVIKNNKVVIVDHSNTGRLNKGCRWTGGIHAFIEARHNLPIQPESLTTAAISHVAYINKYARVIGLTGTIGEATERNEIEHLYNVSIFDVPPHLPNIRIINTPCISSDTFRSNSIVDDIKKHKDLNRPVLVIVESIDESNKLSKKLNESGIAHQVLNTVQREDEEYIITKAGQAGVVTIATNAAGRGTDIILSGEAKKAGGLHVVLTFFPSNLRVEKQAIGRAARQGQPGSATVHLDTTVASMQKYMQAAQKLHKFFQFITSSGQYPILVEVRTAEINILSEQRIAQARVSMVIDGIFCHFMGVRSSIDQELDNMPSLPHDKTIYKKCLIINWNEFFSKIERSRAQSTSVLSNRYYVFIEDNIKPIFEGMDNVQALINHPSDLTRDSFQDLVSKSQTEKERLFAG